MWRRRFSLATRASTSASTGARSSVIAPAPVSIWSAMAAAQAVLLVRGTCTSPSGVRMVISFSSEPMPDALGEDVVEDEQVDALGGLLGPRPVEPRAGLGGEADAVQARARGGREHVDGAHQLERERLALAALDLAALLVLGAEVGDGRGHDEHVRVAHRLGDRRGHLGGALHAHDVVGRALGRLRGHERDPGAAQVGLVGHRAAHLAAGAVADEAHRVDALARAAGGDDDLLAGERPGRRRRRARGARPRGWPRATPCVPSPLRRRRARRSRWAAPPPRAPRARGGSPAWPRARSSPSSWWARRSRGRGRRGRWR